MQAELKGKLSALFPPEHPATPCLVRLMILRDDLEYDLRHVWIKRDDGPEELWRCVYSLRRLAVSILEAQSVLGHDVAKLLKSPADDALRLLSPHIKEVTATVAEAATVLKPIRDALGGHVRPQAASGGEFPDVVRTVLKNHPTWEGTARIDLNEPRKGTYRELTVSALLFAWPHASQDQDVEREHEALQKAVVGTVPKIVRAIDSLLIHHWIILGLLKPGDDHDFAVRDAKTGELVRILLDDGRGVI